MDVVSNLVPWDVAFAQAKYPSVSIITEQGGDVVTLIIAPKGIDQYPKYSVRFNKVITLICYEEAFCLDRGHRIPPHGGCAYLWCDSPAVQSYRRGEDIFSWRDLQHYLIFGGDSIVELIASGQPKIERLDQRQIVEVKHEL